MLNLPSRTLFNLIRRILAKRKWSQSRLAREMNIRAETVSRWMSGAGIHKGHYEELLRIESDTEIALPSQPQGIPFKVKIPRESITLKMDKDGNLEIHGFFIPEINEGGIDE